MSRFVREHLEWSLVPFLNAGCYPMKIIMDIRDPAPSTGFGRKYWNFKFYVHLIVFI